MIRAMVILRNTKTIHFIPNLNHHRPPFRLAYADEEKSLSTKFLLKLKKMIFLWNPGVVGYQNKSSLNIRFSIFGGLELKTGGNFHLFLVC
jgi:hypothetical protein